MSSTVKGPSELKLSITIAPSKTVLQLKEEIASKSEVAKERQRLIYSGMSCLHHLNRS
jgi:ubiquilin